MSKIEKIKERFKINPKALKYKEVELILIHLGFEKIYTKGSHIKFKHLKYTIDIIVPIHNNDCKDFYKKDIRNRLIKFKILK